MSCFVRYQKNQLFKFYFKKLTLNSLKWMTPLLLLLALSCIFSEAKAAESLCYGSTANGRLEQGWQLPSGGTNFIPYTPLTLSLGRNYVHSAVYRAVLKAYSVLETSLPGKFFMYGETGLQNGGPFPPHKTHQNGLSVDFFVPVKAKNGASVNLPTGPENKFGYGVEFDSQGRYGNLQLDFASMVQHLWSLQKAATSEGISIQKVIFDGELQKHLFRAPGGEKLSSSMVFQGKAWVRHDEHYHVDFKVPCLN